MYGAGGLDKPIDRTPRNLPKGVENSERRKMKQRKKRGTSGAVPGVGCGLSRLASVLDTESS